MLLLLMLCSCRDRDTAAVNRDAVRDNMLLKWNDLIDLELIVFPVQLGCYGYGSHCKKQCYANMNVTLFWVSANQIAVFL